MDDDVIGVADNPANRYFDPLTSPTPRTSTDGPIPEPPPTPPAPEPQPDPEPAPAPRAVTPPPRPGTAPLPQPQSAYLYGHDVGLFAETLEDSDETFVQWAARESNADRPTRYPSELKKSTLLNHMVRAARFIRVGGYEDKRAVVRARVRRTKAAIGVLVLSGALCVVLSVVGMGQALGLRAVAGDTYGILAKWAIAAFALAMTLVPCVLVPAFGEMTAPWHLFFLEITVPFFVIFIIPAVGTGVAALPVARGVGTEAYETKGAVLAYISAAGFMSAALAMACLASITLILRFDKKWYKDVVRGKMKVKHWKAYSAEERQPEDTTGTERVPRWGNRA